ncbi:MAG: radical SAM protein [Spirochaetales bacterium]|nr:radical SAM protein [Spirochaetales bacterium]
MGNLIEKIQKKSLENHIILTVMIELTYKCPCDCLHCYLDKEKKKELSTEEVFDLLEQLKDEGTINLSFTGGEPFLRNDFDQILLKARELHFNTGLLTTGILLDETKVKFLEENKIESIDISLHGSDAKTHDEIMQLPGAFDRTLNALKLLQKTKIKVVVKCVIMKNNYRQLEEIKKLAESFGAVFVAQLFILPRINGDNSPQRLMLSKDEILGLPLMNLTGGALPNEDFSTGAIMACTAGDVAAAISPYGDVFPCLLFRYKMGNIREKSIKEIWHSSQDKFIDDFRNQKPQDVKPCFDCALKSYCQRCPATAFLETGDVNGVPVSCCHLAEIMKIRKQKK